MAAIYDPRVKRWVGTGSEPEGHCVHDWVRAAEEGEGTDRNLLNSAPTPIRMAILEALGEWTPYVPKAAPPSESESLDPLPPLTLPRHRA